jgi:hypothetical protein
MRIAQGFTELRDVANVGFISSSAYAMKHRQLRKKIFYGFFVSHKII